jgi:quercetin dioxygenase-like cupin family protein
MQVSIVKNVAIVQWLFRKRGDKAASHIHPHDHMTLVARGSVSVSTEQSGTLVFDEDEIIVVTKEIQHEFTALEDNTVIYCIQALRKSELEDDIVGPDESPDFVAPLSMGASR